LNPMCDNCHIITDTQYECGHDEDSTNCEAFYCIKNVLNTATCDYFGEDWPCQKRNCDTANDGSLPAVVQTTYNLADPFYPCPTGGDPIVFTPWVTYYHGCASSCWANSIDKACAIESCDTSDPMDDPSFIGQKYKCGCP
jgi:hypothetical protein